MPVYRRADITMARGEGVYLYDDQDRSYLDFAAGIAVNALGHSHPHVVAALKDQADRLWHCSNNYKNDQLLRFSERLVAQSPLDTVFFCSSGGEALEAAIKFIRRYHYVQGQAKRNRIITFENGFHGRSMACISAGGNVIAREGYAPLLDGFDRVRFNDLESVEAAITNETAAILLEPIQGEGGIHVASTEFMQGLRRLCDVRGLLLCFDEVQCGYGRTGALFTASQYNVKPDIITCAKGIGNGFPLGACLVTEAIALAMTPGCHGSTYGSNPLAMAVGNAVLDVMLADGFFIHVKAMGEYLRQQLQAVAERFPHVAIEVRGAGLMQGLALAIPARPVADTLRNAGLLVAPAYGEVLRFVPPLIVHQNEIDQAMTILTTVLAKEIA
jgi:acetylornithine/N-succinyldiaminopimelate aminotransferase